MQSIHHKNLIIADSGYWIAIGNKKDHFHQQAIKIFAELKDVPITTWPVITEASYLLKRDCGFLSRILHEFMRISLNILFSQGVVFTRPVSVITGK